MKFLLTCLILVIALAEGADECWKATYNRGTIACSSSEPHDNEGGVCYPKCKDGYYGAGFVCWSRCDASGFSNDCKTILIDKF